MATRPGALKRGNPLVLVNLKPEIAPTEDAPASMVAELHSFWSMHPTVATPGKQEWLGIAHLDLLYGRRSPDGQCVIGFGIPTCSTAHQVDPNRVFAVGRKSPGPFVARCGTDEQRCFRAGRKNIEVVARVAGLELDAHGLARFGAELVIDYLVV